MAHDHNFSDQFGFESRFVVDPTAETLVEVQTRKGLAPPLKMPANSCFASTIAEFSRISAAEKNILIYFWSPSALLRTQLKSHPFEQLPELDLGFKAKALVATVASIRDPLAAQLLHELMPAMARACDLAGGAKNLRLTLGKLQDRMCPLFHVDRVLLRLMCTLRGPGTEWLDDHEVQRENLGKGSNTAVLDAGATIYQLDELHVGLLKGEAFPGSRRKGVVHRSPAVDPASKGRWYLRLDVTT